ncbi:hypothetical protein HOP61_15805 [Halomonas daqingensis]|uniref:DUF4304 domain-containing protein n=2 Tax=Billgrantia desiderata TaxID=52021 RepID=A0AAW4YXF9_9GAMM|nr:hypothetical protein [Halomonas desiderata]
MSNLEINEVQSSSVRHVARQFKWTVDTLYSQSWSAEGPASLIVNGALSIELYLKSFNAQMVFKGEYEIEPGVVGYEDVVTEVLSKGHQPSELYRNLPKYTKDWLVHQFEKEHPGYDLGHWFSQFDGVFINWRYLYEGNVSRVPVTDLLDLIAFLERRSQEIEENNGAIPKR